MNLIDLHCHLLPGIDDGPRSMEGALALAKAFVASGTTRVAATPHVNLRYANTGEQISEVRAALNARLGVEGVDLIVDQGAEVSTDVCADLTDDQLCNLCLGGGDWLLVEAPANASCFVIHEAVFSLQQRGFRILLAHPERCPALQQDIDFIADVAKAGVRTQVTAGAMAGRFGPVAEKTARELFRRHLVHTVASDAHDPFGRPPGMASALAGSGHAEMVEWLCHDMPSWILDGGEEPNVEWIEPQKASPVERLRGLFRPKGAR